MNRILVCFFALIAISSAFFIANIQPKADQCCASCALPLLKYYSIPNTKRCGESCLDPKDYAKYKILEPKMQPATTNTPCADNGFPHYN